MFTRKKGDNDNMTSLQLQGGLFKILTANSSLPIGAIEKYVKPK